MNSNKKKPSYQKNKKFKTLKKTEPDNYQDLEVDQIKAKDKFPNRKLDSRNDPQWYFKDPQILRDVASFSFETRLGSNYHFDKTESSNFGCITSVAGVMAFELAPTPGVAETAQSPLNLAATNVYSFVRYKNSGAVNYDAPDLMMYLQAMDSIYASWNWMKRVYGIASTYSQTNAYAPRAWMEANMIDMDDIISNLADFRAFLNIKASEISAFCVPATMTYNIRHSWIFSNIYKDSDTNKAQTYIFVPSYFYQYSEATADTGAQLIPKPIWLNQVEHTINHSATSKAAYLTFDKLKAYMNELLEAVNYSEDIGIMSGDILKAYGEGGLFKVSSFDPDYRVEPVYSKEVLSQIENMTIMLHGSKRTNNTLTPAQFTINQDPNANIIKFKPSGFKYSDVHIEEWERTYLNFHWENPTPEDVMVATRLSACFQASTETPGTSEVVSCGSEIVIDAWMYRMGIPGAWTTFHSTPYNGQPTELYYLPVEPDYDAFTTPGSADFMRLIYGLTTVSQFDWHPPVKIAVANQPAEGEQLTIDIMFDFDKYTQLDINDVENLHLVALLSEFNVPN